MNERIKEIAVQAELLIKKTNGDEFRYGNFDPKFQKFAELIVKETMGIVAKNISWNGYLDAVEAVAKHFGVEE